MPDKPLIQIDDEVREMTDDEYAQYLIDIGVVADETIDS
jgi:hypothetical protein